MSMNMPTDQAPLLLTPRDAARALSVSERTLWGITAPRGSLPCVKIGRSVRYSVDDLQQWVQAQRGACVVKDSRYSAAQNDLRPNPVTPG